MLHVGELTGRCVKVADPADHEQAQRTTETAYRGREPVEEIAEMRGSHAQRNRNRDRKRRHADDRSRTEQRDERDTGLP